MTDASYDESWKNYFENWQSQDWRYAINIPGSLTMLEGCYNRLLNTWEQGFVANLRKNHATYGEDFKLSKGQMQTLQKIWRKVA